jgi:hypothetical protein
VQKNRFHHLAWFYTVNCQQHFMDE